MKILVEAGHGGTCFGHYFTPGKRSPGKKTSQDEGVFEGEFDREVASLVTKDLNTIGIPAEFLNPGALNALLLTRKLYINKLAKKEDIVLLSIHANASGNKWSNASGARMFIRPCGWTKERIKNYKLSKELALGIEKGFRSNPYIPYSVRPLLEKYFKIVSVNCPAVLCETVFMTNKIDISWANSVNGKEHISSTICDAVKEWYFNTTPAPFTRSV